MTDWLTLGFLFILGSIVGSFLNVCIFRIPKKKSIVFPSSHCPHCSKPIRYYDNIPIISYIILGGKCRNCRTAISFQYFLVELLTALMTLVLFFSFGISWPFVFAFLFSSVLIIITFIDFEHQIIPDHISLPCIPLFFLFSFFLPWTNPIDSILGILAGGGILYLLATGYYMLTKKEGMGGGDIKLLAMIGAFLGWQATILTLVLGAFAGTFIGIAMIIFRGKNFKYAIPFGPFLSLGAFCALLWGEKFIYWYVHLGK